MPNIAQIVSVLNEFAPIELQESYDNSGLLIGNSKDEARSALLCLDITEEVIDEALAHSSNLIVAHHPIIFTGLKSLRGDNLVERCVIKAIQHGLSIYCGHTNFDNVKLGVNKVMASKIGLSNLQILRPKKGNLLKLVTYVPNDHLLVVQEALWTAGAGRIGNYDQASFSHPGKGTFRPLSGAKPFSGELGERSEEAENRLEVLFNRQDLRPVMKALKHSHPYEEVAYDLISLENASQDTGSGMIGEFEEPMSEDEFLRLLKTQFNTGTIRHSKLLFGRLKKVAICGGSGKFLLEDAIRAGADAFVTGDLKYHDFFEVDDKLLLADIGHYESEQYTPLIYKEIINRKFPNFALRLAESQKNPIHYY